MEVSVLFSDEQLKHFSEIDSKFDPASDMNSRMDNFIYSCIFREMFVFFASLKSSPALSSFAAVRFQISLSRVESGAKNTRTDQKNEDLKKELSAIYFSISSRRLFHALNTGVDPDSRDVVAIGLRMRQIFESLKWTDMIVVTNFLVNRFIEDHPLDFDKSTNDIELKFSIGDKFVPVEKREQIYDLIKSGHVVIAVIGGETIAKAHLKRESFIIGNEKSEKSYGSRMSSAAFDDVWKLTLDANLNSWKSKHEKDVSEMKSEVDLFRHNKY